MPITKRTLEKWRADALKERATLEGVDRIGEATVERRAMANQIIRLTQELLDQHLLRRKEG